MSAPAVLGLLLAGGAGRRMGQPKALVIGRDSRPWLQTSIEALLGGGCARVLVVLGAQAEQARALVPADPRVQVVVADDWAEGMGASLRRGLTAAQALRANGIDLDAALVSLVDLPDVDARVIARLIGSLPDSAVDLLARAAYDGRAGHPVVLGAAHWQPVLAEARGDQGARDYLADRQVQVVECGDLATGRDVDRPDRSD